eukprot:CAMPEP_0179222342 /NCGR_PEP_ID=MMETSP0797-20121207/6671_1 /TAXON_ID=47934 /ORGANISM="Dinophysis acuminata, Strain DAEP01" /LENGTH=202 /DNA_ID=CAMNT_0020929181 /DNA_START=236 /DNA_END=844 /DNA_ORIENTATION=+
MGLNVDRGPCLKAAASSLMVGESCEVTFMVQHGCQKIGIIFYPALQSFLAVHRTDCTRSPAMGFSTSLTMNDGFAVAGRLSKVLTPERATKATTETETTSTTVSSTTVVSTTVSSTTATATVVNEYVDGPRVSNVVWVKDCERAYGNFEWAKSQCNADPSCSVLHDWGCDGVNWRHCIKPIERIQARSSSTHACTKVVLQSR